MVARSMTFSSRGALNHFGLDVHPAGTGSPQIDPRADILANTRSSLAIAEAF